MGLYGMMRTSTSGMAAQANRLSTVADNIANSSTTGYKRTSTEFSSLILQSGTSEYVSGSVETRLRQGISEQGAFKFTTSSTDLAIKGSGFFVVGNANGQTYLTRAGSFVKDGEGNLVNAAGYQLMGYDLSTGSPTVITNSTAGLVPVNVDGFALEAHGSTIGQLQLNVPSNATITAAGNLPGANAATATFEGKTSMVAYDSLGNQVTLDIYTAKSASGTWQVSVYNQANQASGGGFPYSSGPLATTSLSFGTDGQLTSSSSTALTFTVPNGESVTIDMGRTTQLATNYTVMNAALNGNAPSEVDSVQIDNDGTLYAVFENGERVAAYRIPLADVPSPDNLQALAGNVFAIGTDSGDLRMGFADQGGFGSVISSALEQSTVDLASELTAMIESERNYTANSKVFQTGAELMDVLVNLKR
jgi:flagellar hook protein FlgE